MDQIERKHSNSSIKLASSDKIITAANDPAGLAISEKLRANIRSMAQAERNANDSISFIHVAEGALSIMGQINNRMRELAIQSASDTVGQGERSMIGQEYEALKSEISRISKITEYNSTKLLSGGKNLDLQIGINDTSSDKLTYNMKDVLDHLNSDRGSVFSKESSQRSLSIIDRNLGTINKARTKLGAMNARVNSIVQNLQISKENHSAAKSRIRDTDIAQESAINASLQINKKATIAVLAQTTKKFNGVKRLLE
jgi:flagellin